MLSVGDTAFPFSMLDQDGKRLFLRDQVGTPLLLLFYRTDSDPLLFSCLQAFQHVFQHLERIGVKLLSISQDDVARRSTVATENHFTFPLLSDPDLAVSSYYGLCEIDPLDDDSTFSFPCSLLLLDRNLKVLNVYSPFSEKGIQQVLDDLQRLCPREEPWVVSASYTPPVLLVPNVLDRTACQELITVWKTQGHQEGHFMRSDGKRTYGVIDHRIKKRQDHFIGDENIKLALTQVFQNRLFPEIEKCFNYTVTEFEHYKIACYDAETGGYFRPHRDNTSGGTAHRRWALSLNLNSEDYEGGYLRFPEYGPQLYKSATGSAVIFSCSLMHEATEVTAGQRFVLLSFFYGEKESKTRNEYESSHGTEDYLPEALK